MAKTDRCQICDYTEAHGSSYGGVAPAKNGRVRSFGSELLCQTCVDIVVENYLSLIPRKEEEGEVTNLETNEQLGEDTPAVPESGVR